MKYAYTVEEGLFPLEGCYVEAEAISCEICEAEARDSLISRLFVLPVFALWTGAARVRQWIKQCDKHTICIRLIS